MMLDRFTGYKRLLALATLNGGGASIIERTASGNPLTFGTDLVRPLRSLLIHFTPIQQGSGDPSPENVRPIIGWNGLNVWNGKNLLDEENVPAANRYIKYVSPTSAQWMSSKDSRSYKWEAEPNTTYTIHAMNSNITVFRVCALENGELSEESTNAYQWNGTGERVCTITTSATEHYLIIQINKSIAIDKKGYVFVAKGTAEENPITDTDIVFPSPVYGGTLDVVSGVLTVTHELWTKHTATMDYSVNYPGWKEAGIKSLVGAGLNETFRDQKLNVGSLFTVNTTGINDVLFLPKEYGYGLSQEEWIALAIDVQIAVPLATPQEITLTPEQITAIKGNNTIWSDANGEMTAVYLLTESFGDEHPISGGLGSGLLGGGLGSGTGEPDEPVDPDEPGEPDQPGEE